jgi:DnaJ-class molecular chaperone
MGCSRLCMERAMATKEQIVREAETAMYPLVRCPDCYGSGTTVIYKDVSRLSKPKKCGLCKGKGKIKMRANVARAIWGGVRRAH